MREGEPKGQLSGNIVIDDYPLKGEFVRGAEIEAGEVFALFQERWHKEALVKKLIRTIEAHRLRLQGQKPLPNQSSPHV